MSDPLHKRLLAMRNSNHLYDPDHDIDNAPDGTGWPISSHNCRAMNNAQLDAQREMAYRANVKYGVRGARWGGEEVDQWLKDEQDLLARWKDPIYALRMTCRDARMEVRTSG